MSWYCCDIVHPDVPDYPADWALIGEAGDCYLCDEHFQQMPWSGRAHWQRISPAPVSQEAPQP